MDGRSPVVVVRLQPSSFEAEPSAAAGPSLTGRLFVSLRAPLSRGECVRPLLGLIHVVGPLGARSVGVEATGDRDPDAVISIATATLPLEELRIALLEAVQVWYAEMAAKGYRQEWFR